MTIYEPNGRRAWGIVVLLFLFSMINFVDKLVMGLAAVPIMREFSLSPSEYGTLSSSFFFLFATSGLMTGLFIVHRVSTKWLLVALVLIWTLSQVPMVLGSSLAALYLGRILLGVGEGPGTPSAYHALYGWFTSDRRNLPTSLLLAGVGTGFLVGAPVLTHVIAKYGWRAGFLFAGVIGAAWLVAWLLLGADGPLTGKQVSPAAPAEVRVPWGQFWSDKTVIANLILASSCYWMIGLSITWLAPYLQLGLGYSARDTGWLVSVILGAQVVGPVAISYVSHRMLLSGLSSRLSRGVVLGACPLVAGIALALATLVDNPTGKVALLTVAFTLPQLAFVIGPAIVGEVAPMVQRGNALLVTYSVITVTGLLAPIVTGRVVQAAGASPLLGYTHALWLAAAVLTLGGLWGLAWLNPEASRARFSRATAAPLAAPLVRPV